MSASIPRAVVVTGASRGIGRAIAGAFAAGGWSVWGLARDADDLGTLADETGAETAMVDLEKPEEIARFFDRLSERGIRLDAVVNNAAIMGGSPIEDQGLDSWERFLRINVTAPWLMIKHAKPLLAPDASIINIGSVASVNGYAKRAAYCASKHALLGMTKALALELAPVRVNLLCLGSFETPGLTSLAGGQDVHQAFGPRQLLGRLGRVEEAAAAALFLASPQSAFMTGSTMTVDGGMLVKGAG